MKDEREGLGGRRLVAVSDTSNGGWEKDERETGERWPVAVSIQGEKSCVD